MKKSISMLLLVTFIATLFAQDIVFAQKRKRDKYSLAVLNLNAIGEGISSTDTRLITTRLNEELNNTGMFHIMSQTDMERGLFAKNFDPSGCSSIECAIRAGRALGVQLVIIGSITQNPSSYAIDIQMIHVASKAIVKDFRDNLEGDLNDLYNNMRFIALELMGVSRTQAPSRSEETTRAQLPVTEFPDPERLPESERYYDNGGGFKWIYVGIGLLVAGGVGAGLLLANKNSGGGGGVTTTNGDLDNLPGPPTFP